jgi:hypothetical protein
MSAVSEAVRLLRATADWQMLASGDGIEAKVNLPIAEQARLIEAADALERLVTGPPAAEVERLADVHCRHALAKDGAGTWRQNTANGIHAVLRALGEQP